MRAFHVIGTFAAGMYEFDRNFAYVHMQDAARLYRMGDDTLPVVHASLRRSERRVSGQAQNAIAQLLFESVHYGQHDDQHGDADRNSHH
jgi:lipoprotein-releasing system permease protein